jgi:hypothetical protein
MKAFYSQLAINGAPLKLALFFESSCMRGMTARLSVQFQPLCDVAFAAATTTFNY